MKSKITKIVITGGPCAGKSTALNRIQENFEQLGYTVIFVPETATELINAGISPISCASNLDFQINLFKLQLQKEKIFSCAAETMPAEKILMLCDRGTIDNKAYMTADEFAQTIKEIGLSEVELRDSYDAVFHLETTAKGAEDFYTTENNTARTETAEQAIEIDNRLISAWTGHPHFRIIDNSTDFEGKLKRLNKEIASFLGEPKPFEIERKFLIEYPDEALLENNPNCKRVDIIQTYLLSADGREIRVRQRGIQGSYIYFKTEKKYISPTTRIEIEERLTKDEYIALLEKTDAAKAQIKKSRYCLSSGSFYFEIDIYPFWSNKAIMEIELSDESQKIIFPDGIKIIKEVTDDRRYSNSALARNHNVD